MRSPARTSNARPRKIGSPEYCRPRSRAETRIIGARASGGQGADEAGWRGSASTAGRGRDQGFGEGTQARPESLPALALIVRSSGVVRRPLDIPIVRQPLRGVMGKQVRQIVDMVRLDGATIR